MTLRGPLARTPAVRSELWLIALSGLVFLVLQTLEYHANYRQVSLCTRSHAERTRY